MLTEDEREGLVSERQAYEKVILLIPEPLFKAWNSLVELCLAVKKCEPRISSCSHWPILALAIRGADLALSVGTLASMRQWPDACILGRTLFETEILVKWLLESDTDRRIAEYLAEVEEEKGRFRRKMEAGLSTATQVMRDLFSAQSFSGPQTTGRKKRAGSHGSVRGKAQTVNLERSYDLPYWMMSIFAHSHAICLSKWHPELMRARSPFVHLFGFESDDLPAWMALTAIPLSALDLFQLTNHHLDLNLSEQIEATRQAFRDGDSKLTGGVLRFSKDVQRGEIRLESSDGTVTSYKSPRSGRDPIDDLL
jgi:hypothetical protein